MLDNFRFQVATLATEDRVRASRGRQSVSSQGIKRIFRLGGDRQHVRQAGPR
ncbi:MAG TPA: hypothetical protein VK600_03650 [Candidatus Saccharimonadales bacterium]|nr:hypothetical protein [Candidatus Saccharimonadales bacterium]